MGVERRLAYKTPTLALPRSTRGGEEDGLQNVSRTRPIWVRDTFCGEFPPPPVLRGRVGVGVERRLAYKTPTLALPRSTRGGEEDGLQNVSRTRPIWVRDTFCGEFPPPPVLRGRVGVGVER